MRIGLSLSFILAVLSLITAAIAADQERKTGQHAENSRRAAMRLITLLYLPPDYNKESEKKWPLIVFLHGSGSAAPT